MRKEIHVVSSILATKSLTAYEFSAFGEEKQKVVDSNPWRFASKRFDPELGLLYFGKRYYDPELGRWLTTDPAGFVDGVNLYQYLFNNPFRYTDPDGQFIFAIPILTWALGAAGFTFAGITTAEVVGIAALTVTAAWAGNEAYKHCQHRHADRYAPVGIYAKSAPSKEEEKKKKEDVRTEPKDLSEQLALEEAKAKPQNPEEEIMKDKIKDPRYPPKEWKKMKHVHEQPDGTKIDIHYWEHRTTGAKHGFKFKNN